MKEQLQRVNDHIHKLWGAHPLWLIPLCILLALCIEGVGGKKPWETHWAERVAEGRPPGFSDYVACGHWVAAVVGLVVTILLIVTARWWAKLEKPKPLTSLKLPEHRRLSAFFLVCLAFIMVFSTVIRLPRMTHSLWGDEEWATRDYVVGEFLGEHGEQLQWKPLEWKRTLFYNHDANNHVLYSVLSRLTLGLWQETREGQPWEFAEWALRVPALAAGLGSICMLAIFLAQWREEAAGLAAALLMGLHPWHLRYSTEARGYTLVLLFLPAFIWIAAVALRDGRWRWWLALALLSFLLMISWTGALYPLAMMQVVIGLTLLWSLIRGHLPATIPRLWRWLFTQAIAFVAMLWVLAPSLPQVHLKVTTSAMFKGEMSTPWLRELGAHFFTGTSYLHPEPGNPFSFALRPQWGDNPIFWAGIGAVLAIAGAIFMIRRWGLVPAGLVLAPLGAMALAWLHLGSQGVYMQVWYLIYGLPTAIILIVGGLFFLPQCLLSSLRAPAPWRPAGGMITLSAVILLFAWSTRGITQTLQRYPIEDFRLAAALTRSAQVDPDPAGIQTIILWRGALLYDPHAHCRLREGEQLLQLINQCHATGKQLRVVVGVYSLAKTVNRDFLEVLEDPDIFDFRYILWGQDDACTLRLYFLRPPTDAGDPRPAVAMAFDPRLSPNLLQDPPHPGASRRQQ